MSNKKMCGTVGMVFLGFAISVGVARAEVVINEVMYDLDGSDIDWVEVYNGGEGEADLSSLKLLISNSTSNHGIVKYSGLQAIPAGGYGIIIPTSQISAFTGKWGSEGNLFTSSFTLPNLAEGESATAQINAGDKNSPLSSFTYDTSLGAKADGNSLQLVDGSWGSGVPTPGKENRLSGALEDKDDDSEENEDNDANEGSSSSSKNSRKKYSSPEIKAKISAKSSTFAGIPLEFQAAITENSKEVAYYGKYLWNFGDGSYFEQTGIPEKLNHIYFYPGDYNVSLEYYPDCFAVLPKVAARMAVKAVPVDVSVSKIGDERDFFVELVNDSAYEADISGWTISANGKIFILPKNSLILPKKKITLSGGVTGFRIGDEKNLEVISSAGKTIFKYED